MHEILHGLIAMESQTGGRITRCIITVRTHTLGHGQHAEDAKTVRSSGSIGTAGRALPGGKHKKIYMVFTER